MADLSLLNQHKDQLDALWQRFRDYRSEQGKWTNLLRRRDAIHLQPELDEYAQGIDIQSSVLEEEAILRKHILVLNPAKVDVVAQEEGVHAKEEAEDVRIWFASLLMELDADMRVSDPVSADQVMHGVSFWRKTWQMPREPEEADMPEKERAEYFENYQEQCFGLEHVPIGSLAFMPLEDPTVFVQETEVDYLEWRELKNKEGKYATLDEAKKVAFVGEEKESYSAEVAGQTMHLIRHAYKVPGSDDWKICEWLTAAGSGERGVSPQEMLVEYDVPGGAPYEVIPAGEEMRNESDPHLRYRPQLYPLYTVIYELNYAVSTLMAWARKRLGDQSMYVEIGALNDQGRAVLEGMGFNMEGTGANTKLVFSLPEPGSRELMIAPKLSEVPLPKPEELIIRIQMLSEEVNRLRSNRFLTGGARPEEISQGTATALTSQTQQASIPFSASVKKQAAGWKRYLNWVRNVILEWDEDVPEGARKKYYILTSGDEPLQRGKADPGKILWVDAGKMGRKFETLVYIRNVTEAEQAERDARAVAKYDRGLITLEQLLDEMGFDDPEKQKRELNKEKHRREYAGRFKQITAMAKDTLFSALSGVNLSLLMAPMPGEQPEGGGEPAASANVNPGNMMQPPPMSSPQGMSNPTAGQMV